MIHAAAARPLKARVIERRDDGSAIVEVPVLVETQELNLARTSGGGTGTVSITRADLDEMVANFSTWPKPVAFGFDVHEDYRSGPQPAFADSVHVEDGALWARCDLNAFAANLIVGQRAYRGFSVEASKNVVTPTREMRGWVLTGGIFTNNPATDTQFRIAASGEFTSELSGSASCVLAWADEAKESDMAVDTQGAAPAQGETVTVQFHEAKIGETQVKLQAAEDKVRSLSEQVETLRESQRASLTEREQLRLEAEQAKDDKLAAEATANRAVSEAKSLRADNRELSAKLNESGLLLAKAEAENLSIKVREAIAEAIDGNVAPKVFDGHESNPAEWMLARFASLEAFTDHCKILATGIATPSGKPVKSGHEPSKPSDHDSAKLSEADKAKLKSLGIMDFGWATTETEARAAVKANNDGK